MLNRTELIIRGRRLNIIKDRAIIMSSRVRNKIISFQGSNGGSIGNSTGIDRNKLIIMKAHLMIYNNSGQKCKKRNG